MEKQLSLKDGPSKAVPWGRVLLYVLLLAAGGLRFSGVGDKSFWVDELRANRAAKEWEEILPYCREGNTPPLRYFLIHFLISYGCFNL